MIAIALLAAVMNMGGVEVNGEWVTKTERREFADGYAERYVLPEGRRMIGGERTTWTLPADATVWYQTMRAGDRGAGRKVPRRRRRQARDYGEGTGHCRPRGDSWCDGSLRQGLGPDQGDG